MKLFSTLFLTLTLIASSAFHSVHAMDEETMTLEEMSEAFGPIRAHIQELNYKMEQGTCTQNDWQEILACGILYFNETSINQALDAGANPFTLHKTALVQAKVFPRLSKENLKKLLENEEFPPYMLIGGKTIIPSAGKHFDIFLLLLKRGISVDRAEFGYTFRQHLDLALEDLEALRDLQVYRNGELCILKPEDQKEVCVIIETLKQVLTLMHQYQPVDMDYASSFSLVLHPEKA